ncbi:MAG TPA: hypothetical protein VMU89_01960 [Thermomicrobiaceae bacterium]|nr:hypothetical protein [Thermomicrobiaceae bacterium]
MSITRGTSVIRVSPRISRDTFIRILDDAGSPAVAEAGAGYDAVAAEGVDPCFALAVFHHESGYGKAGVTPTYGTRSPGNTRTKSTPDGELVTVPGKGQYVRHTSWIEGWRDLAHRLVSPSYPYAARGAITIEQIIPIWAPASDNNSPETYIAAVVTDMAAWADTTSTTSRGSSPGMDHAPRVALAAGHHNTDGGNATEISIVGPLCREYALAFRQLGCDVRVITPQDGLGQFPGGLQAVAQKVVDFAGAGWVADLFLEVHTEGAGGVRGVFGIYPDWGSDVDADARDTVIPAMVKAISGVTGIPVRAGGLMSERNTGVGTSGYRLGVFLRSAPVAATTTRLLIEHGAHDAPADLTVLQSPGMLAKIAGAAATAAYLALGAPLTAGTLIPATPAAPAAREFPTGMHLRNGFLSYYEEMERAGNQLAVRTLGLPITEEFTMRFSTTPDQDQRVQLFERGGLQWDSGNTAPWDLHALPVMLLIEAYLHALDHGLVSDTRTPLLRERLRTEPV